MDFFGGKSWKINNLFIYLNVGVNNLLDKKDFITGGYEQYRFDFEGKNVNRFPPRYFYGFGRNYFVSLAFRI
jgi:outer membrane receptor protein involved in Fe transport